MRTECQCQQIQRKVYKMRNRVTFVQTIGVNKGRRLYPVHPSVSKQSFLLKSFTDHLSKVRLFDSSVYLYSVSVSPSPISVCNLKVVICLPHAPRSHSHLSFHRTSSSGLRKVVSPHSLTSFKVSHMNLTRWRLDSFQSSIQKVSSSILSTGNNS